MGTTPICDKQLSTQPGCGDAAHSIAWLYSLATIFIGKSSYPHVNQYMLHSENWRAKRNL
jgi:hypothetical protein